MYSKFSLFTSFGQRKLFTDNTCIDIKEISEAGRIKVFEFILSSVNDDNHS